MTTETPAQDLRSALEPCPFCGGAASLYRMTCDRTGEETDDWFVRCDPCDLIHDAAWGKPRSEAIGAWNRRAALAQPAENAKGGVGATDAVIAAKAREALGTWLAWPDAPRDGPRPVTNEQVESWLHGLPNRLVSTSPAPDRGEVDSWSDANMLRSIARDVDRLASNATGDGAPSSGDTLRDIAARLEALKPADATPAGEAVPADVVALVVAAREAIYGSVAPMQELEHAVEAFASRVCWDDDGGEVPEAHADPCTCGLATPPALDEGEEK